MKTLLRCSRLYSPDGVVWLTLPMNSFCQSLMAFSADGSAFACCAVCAYAWIRFLKSAYPRRVKLSAASTGFLMTATACKGLLHSEQFAPFIWSACLCAAATQLDKETRTGYC